MESSLVSVLSFILTKMVERNDKLPHCNVKRTVFHAEKAPLISLPRYLERVLSYAPCSNSCFIIALIYIDRIIQSNSDFILNSFSVHRMLITSVMLATKFFDDETFNNLYYARVGGLQVSELNQLEQKFLLLIDFTLTIQAEVFERYRCELSRHAKVTCCPKTVCPPKAQAPPAENFTRVKLSKSSSSIPTPRPKASAAAAPSLVRSVSEALIVESTKDTELQCKLLHRMSDLLTEEEKLHDKVSPGCIKDMCTKLVAENNLSPTLITRASAQVERLERLEKVDTNNTWYQSGCDYTSRDSLSPPPVATYNTENTSNLDFGKMSINNKVSWAGFSQFTSSPSTRNHSNMVAV